MRCEQSAGDSRSLSGDHRTSQQVVRQDRVSRLLPERVHRVGSVVDCGPERDLIHES